MPPSEQATSAAEALAAWSQIRRIMAIGTPLGPDRLLLKSFSVSEGLGRLFTISAELLSTDPNIDFDQIVGQNVTIRVTPQYVPVAMGANWNQCTSWSQVL